MSATVATYLGTYCERAGAAGLFAEPLNTVTNLGFVIAAFLAARSLAAAHPRRALDLWILVVFLTAIGIGSALWHLAPTPHTVLMDVIPITAFINLYLLSALRRLLALPWRAVVGWWGVYFAVGLAAQTLLPANLLNGTIMYVPTYLTLGLLTVVVNRRDRFMGGIFRGVFGVWSISLVLRTFDIAICEHFQFGTHFLWHVLNSWVLWRLLVQLIKHSSETMQTAP